MKLNFIRLFVMVAFLTAGSVQAAETWRTYAVKAADRLAERIEALDEVLHEVEEDHGTAPFKKAVEDIHHIERLVLDLISDLPTAPFAELCEDFHHLYEDLVKIRLDLIALGLERNPEVVRTWNNMANTYNRELNPYFQGCHHSWSWEASSANALELL